MQLQKILKGVARQNFELRNISSGTRVVTKDMVDYQAVRAHFDQNSPNLLYLLSQIGETREGSIAPSPK
jgi:hypothetical protein